MDNAHAERIAKAIEGLDKSLRGLHKWLESCRRKDTGNQASSEGPPLCPDCGVMMVVKRNRSTGEPFWGCAGYPECRGMRPMNEPEEHENPQKDNYEYD